LKSKSGNYRDIEYEIKTYDFPTNYLYLYTRFKDDIIGGAYYDHILKIEY